MIKKILCGLFAVAMIMQARIIPILAQTEIKVMVDGEYISFDQSPVMENGRVLVPMRAIFEALGYTVEWDGYFQSVSANLSTGDIKREVYVHVGDLCMSLYDNKPSDPACQVSFFVPLDPEQSPIKNINGRILLPTRAIAEALGCSVDWDGEGQTVIIDSTNAKIIPPQGWVEAMEAHSAKYVPGLLNIKSSWTESDQKNQMVLAGDAAIQMPISEPPTESNSSSIIEFGQKQYTVFDSTWNKEFVYSYNEPSISTSPPQVGSVPANILIDESKSSKLFIDNPNSPLDPTRNVTDPYYGGFTYGGCNWYAGGRFWEVYGIPFPHFDKMFDTPKYLDKAELYDEFTVIRDVNDIRANAIAVYIPTTSTSTPHVLFIEYVERDANGKPTYVYFTEANANNPTGEYRHGVDGAVKKLAFHSFINRSKQQCIGYIIPNPDFYK